LWNMRLLVRTALPTLGSTISTRGRHLSSRKTLSLSYGRSSSPLRTSSKRSPSTTPLSKPTGSLLRSILWSVKPWKVCLEMHCRRHGFQEISAEICIGGSVRDRTSSPAYQHKHKAEVTDRDAQDQKSRRSDLTPTRGVASPRPRNRRVNINKNTTIATTIRSRYANLF
jgi:hypothetical protein